MRRPLILLVLLLAPPSHAVVVTVDSTVDAVDANPGDGICADATGVCTLRAAVMETNALPGPDVIVVPAGHYVLTIPGADEDAGATGDLDVRDELTLQGSGAAATILDAAEIDRVLDVRTSFTELVVVSGLAITGGHCAGGTSSAGGGILCFFCQLSLADMTVSGNRSSSNGGGIGVYAGELEARDVVIAANSAQFLGGGVILDRAVGRIESSSIVENQAGEDGGVSVRVGALRLVDSSVLRNVAQSGAAGIAGRSQGGIVSTGSSYLTLERSVVAHNSGDGVVLSGVPGRPAFPSVLSAINTTVSGNAGFGIRSAGSSDFAYLDYSTVSDNGGGGLSAEPPYGSWSV